MSLIDASIFCCISLYEALIHCVPIWSPFVTVVGNSILRVYVSSRKLEEATSQNVVFMWLCGMNTPDHNTINNFRGKKLQGPLKSIFVETVKLLSEEGLLSIKDIFTDGTKLEANANRYTFVWGKGIKNNKEKIANQLEQLWSYAQGVAAE